jgi:hypothetical protein
MLKKGFSLRCIVFAFESKYAGQKFQPVSIRICLRRIGSGQGLSVFAISPKAGLRVTIPQEREWLRHYCKKGENAALANPPDADRVDTNQRKEGNL